MSKSTDRYGKILYTIKTGIDANPTLIPDKLTREWQEHVGCEELLTDVLEKKPKVNIFGHIR